MTEQQKNEAGEVIARALFGTNTDPRAMSDYILGQLSGAGFALVRVADPMQTFGDGALYTEGSAAGTVYARAGMVHHGDWEWTPEQARDVGIQWITAAIDAEGVATEQQRLVR